MKKILNISLWSILIIGLFVTLGFVSKEQDRIYCKSFGITINNEDENFFIKKDDVKNIINDKGNSIVNQPLSSLNIPELENILNSNASVERAEVYVTIGGEVKVDIIQRKPIIRILIKKMKVIISMKVEK